MSCLSQVLQYCREGAFPNYTPENLMKVRAGPAGVSEIRLYILQYAVQFGAIPRFHTRKYIQDYSL